MNGLLHLSDTHFGSEQSHVVEALVRLAWALQPEAIVLSGDITQRATAEQFRAARGFVDRLPRVPLLAVPGNHDIPLYDLGTRIARPYARYVRCFGHDLEPTYRSPRWLVLALNTTRPWRHKHGELSREQVARVAAALRAAEPGQRRLLVVHQPIGVARPEDEADRLRGSEQALQAWSHSGADAVLGGHIHLPYVLPWWPPGGGMEPSRAVWVVQAGTAVSSRVRAGVPNSVNFLRHRTEGARAFEVEQWDHDAAAGEFVRAATTPAGC